MSSGARYLAETLVRRLLLGMLTAFVVSLVIFFCVEMLPGTFAEAILGQSASPEAVAAFQRELGLDRPAMVRYFEWIFGVLRGDFGYSFSSATSAQLRPVADMIGPRLQNTFFLALTTAAVAVPVAIAFGVIAALYRNRLPDRAINAVTLTAIALPEFFVAYVLIFIFAVKLRWLPVLSTLGSSATLSEHLVKAILPATTLAFVITAHIMRMTRASLVAQINLPYVEMATLKGIAPWRVMVHHILPNAWAPIAVVVALNLSYLIVGVVVVEVVFAYPGVGQLMVDAVAKRDFPVVQACAMIFAFTYIGLNLAADMVAIVTNPRLLHAR